MTDEEIILSLCSGNGSVFHILYDRYAARGKNYAYSFLHNESDSEEAVQEAFCRLLKPMRQGAVDAAKGGFSAVFFGTLRNYCIDLLRKKRLRSHLPLEAVPEPGYQPEQDKLSEGEMETRVQNAIEGLPDQQADALKLKLRGGLSYDQIAVTLGCTHGQVRTWIYRARKQLAESFREQGLMEGRE